jgi:hypothetical protein
MNHRTTQCHISEDYNVVLSHPVALVLLSFVRTYNHRLKCNTLLRHVSVPLGHHQVYTLVLKLLHCHLSMSYVKALLFLISKSVKSLEFHRIADSAALLLVVRCVWISAPCRVGLFCRWALPSDYCLLSKFSTEITECAGCEVFTAQTMRSIIFWHV